MPSDPAPNTKVPDIDPKRLQHDPEYRAEVIGQIASRFLKIAEQMGFDTTYEQLVSERPDLTREVSGHVEAKVESLVEQAITKERLRRGEVHKDSSRKDSNLSRQERPASSGGSSGLKTSDVEPSGAEPGEVIALPTN